MLASCRALHSNNILGRWTKANLLDASNLSVSMKISNNTREEMLVWVGFAVSFSIAFFIIILGQETLMEDQVWAIWTVAMSTGFISHGIWHGEKIIIFGSFLSILVTLFSLVFFPPLFPMGWIILGCAVTISSFLSYARFQSLIGVYVTLGGIITLLSVYLTGSALSALMVWMVLAGLIFIAVAMETGSPIVNLMGACWILVSVTSFLFVPDLMLPLLLITFIVGTSANFFYLYRLLGRTPKIGEIFSFTTRAFSLHGLKKPINQYRVLAILIRGNIGAENVINDLLSRLEVECGLILLLGPTAPIQISFPKKTRIGWVTAVSIGVESDYTVLPPEDPSKLSVFLTKTLKTLSDREKPVILGDFLDNMIPQMSESTFYKFYSDLTSTVRMSNYTVVSIVKADIHSEVTINVVKRFADVIIENREREEKGRLVREVRVSNQVDNIHTNWEKY